MKKLIYILPIVILGLFSCEKVIEVELKNSASQLVIDALLTDSLGYHYVKLSKSSNFFSVSADSVVDGAFISVEDQNQNSYKFVEVEPGLYQSYSLKINNSESYKLNIEYKSSIYTAQSTCPTPVEIDSIKVERSPFTNGDIEFYRVNCFFQDDKNVENFYRLRLVVNRKQIIGYFVINDQFFNGKQINYAFNGLELSDRDTLRVDLMGIDQANYKYFYSLARTSGNGGNSSTPGNPPSNIQGQALGVFGAASIHSKIKIIDLSNIK